MFKLISLRIEIYNEQIKLQLYVHFMRKRRKKKIKITINKILLLLPYKFIIFERNLKNFTIKKRKDLIKLKHNKLLLEMN